MLEDKFLALGFDLTDFFLFLAIVENEGSQALFSLYHTYLIVEVVDGILNFIVILIYVIFAIELLLVVVSDHKIIDILLVLRKQALDIYIDVLFVLGQLIVHFLHQFLFEL